MKTCIISIINVIIIVFISIGFVVMDIKNLVKNNRGWQRMEADRKAKGQPYFGMDVEELEKEKYSLESKRK